MGSTVMHLCLTKKVIDNLKMSKNKNYEEINKIYIGSVLPDFHDINKKSKNQSHYIIEVVKNGIKSRVPDISLFLKTYEKEIMKDNYLLGELIHLVSDKIWYSEYIPKYAQNISEDGKEIFEIKSKRYIPFVEFKDKIYTDYMSINQYILKKYKVDLNYILDNEENKLICDNILENSQINLDSILTRDNISKKIFTKLNYIQNKDIEAWLKKSEKEILKVIYKIEKSNIRGE